MLRSHSLQAMEVRLPGSLLQTLRFHRCCRSLPACFAQTSLVCNTLSSRTTIADPTLDSMFLTDVKRGVSTLASLSSTSTSVASPLLPSTSSTVYRNTFLINSPYLACSKPGEQLKIGVLLSGGVDSSVALRLLLAAGHSCTAFYLKIWFQEDFENFWSSCPWDEDLKYAKAVCDEVGVELQVVELTNDYWEQVVSYMVQEYHAGRTPNPDVLCNSRIKFGVFLNHVKNLGFDRVASGHYARVGRVMTSSGATQAVLHLSKDEVKDQTYFLSHLTQSQLSRLMFPLGCVSKAEVRQIAEWLGLPNKQRKDSQGICFLGKVKFSDFIARHLGEREGKIFEAETGTYLGSHRGYWFYTIGQRQGLRLSHGPWYVVDKDQANNVIFVSKEYFSLDKRRRKFEVRAMNWLNGQSLEDLASLRCKVRHGRRFYECSFSFLNNQGSKALVQLSDDDQGIAAGQYAAFYRGDTCLGSGVISEFTGESRTAVSVEARKAAKMELPLSNLSKSKMKKLASLQKKSMKEITTESSQETLGLLHKIETLVKKWFSWIRLT